MKERIIQEIELLCEKYPNLQHGDNHDWIMIPDFTLPEGWNSEQTKLLILIPPSYPHTPPDNFYVKNGLRLKNDNMPGSYNEGASVPIEGDWGCFSWHSEKWQPLNEIHDGDNLVTFIRSVMIRLRESN